MDFGIRKNDIIRSINGKRITSLGELVSTVSNKPVGSTLRITASRDGELRDFNLLLREKKFYQRIRILEGFIPICANCKKIRHEQNWNQIEQYISDHSLVTFTHSICPDCMKELYPELCDDETK